MHSAINAVNGRVPLVPDIAGNSMVSELVPTALFSQNLALLASKQVNPGKIISRLTAGRYTKETGKVGRKTLPFSFIADLLRGTIQKNLF